MIKFTFPWHPQHIVKILNQQCEVQWSDENTPLTELNKFTENQKGMIPNQKIYNV